MRQNRLDTAIKALHKVTAATITEHTNDRVTATAGDLTYTFEPATNRQIIVTVTDALHAVRWYDVTTWGENTLKTVIRNGMHAARVRQEDHAALMRVLPRTYTTSDDGQSLLTIEGTPHYTVAWHDNTTVIASKSGSFPWAPAEDHESIRPYLSFLLGNERTYADTAANYLLDARTPAHWARTDGGWALAYPDGLIIINSHREIITYQANTPLLVCRSARDLENCHDHCEAALNALKEAK